MTSHLFRRYEEHLLFGEAGPRLVELRHNVLLHTLLVLRGHGVPLVAHEHGGAGVELPHHALLLLRDVREDQVLQLQREHRYTVYALLYVIRNWRSSEGIWYIEVMVH
jgi:hypothetical protein